MTLSAALQAEIEASVRAQADALFDVFTDIHRHPELGFMEIRTAGILAAQLRALGFSVTDGIGGTGVAAVLANGDGPTVMYRADMDANAVEEATGLPYASTVRVTRADGAEVPVAHQCGHDAHVTWMIGAARVLAEHRDRWRGTAVLIGQPAEEPITGAKAMVADGLYDVIPLPDAYVALHTAPAPVGLVLAAGGVRMAGTDQIDILVRGAGGHGSAPQRTKDPVVMAATAVVQYQSIVSRMVDPQQTAVLTVGALHAGADNNVIPDTALIKANLRWFDPAVRETLVRGIHTVTDGIARSHGVDDGHMPVYTEKGGATPLVNDVALTTRLADALADARGEQTVMRGMPPVTGSEDAHLLRGPHDIPFSYLMVGIADPDECRAAADAGRDMPFSPHSPEFHVDPAAIPAGAAIAATVLLELLQREA